MKKKGKKEEEEEEEENLVVNKTPKPNRKARNEGKKKRKKKEKKGRGKTETEKVRDPSRRDDAAAHAMTLLPMPTQEKPILLSNTHAAISCRIPKPETHLATAVSCLICTTHPSFVAPLLQPS